MRFYVAVFALLMMALAPGSPKAQQSLPLDRLRLPPGFQIEVFARVPKARTMVILENWSVVLVGSRGDTIHMVIDRDRDGKVDEVAPLMTGLKSANGIAWKDGWFYVAEQHRISRFRAPDLKTLRQAKAQVLFDQLPDHPWHGWRYARFGPDGMLYVAVGSPCNVCSVSGIEGTIIRLDPAGGKPEIFASGVRNSVGFDFQPTTGDLFFTDNGADQMGDDSPPDELNHAPAKGLWFGFPYFGGGRDRTPDFKGAPLPRKATFPVIEFGAHVASLGVSFYKGNQFPKTFRHDAIVAQHGSWNRSVPDGYRLMRIKFDKARGSAKAKEIFIDGWLNASGQSWGRPVDVKEMSDGSVLVSDDKAGAIYKITYRKP